MSESFDDLLPKSYVVTCPNDLKIWLRVLNFLIVKGLLIQRFDCEDEFSTNIPVEDVIVEGPWPDFIYWNFEDRAGVKFVFCVETYHGTGGEWRRA